MKIFSLLFTFCMVLGASESPFYYDGTKRVSLKPLPTLLRSNAGVNYYEDAKGVRVGVSNKILVQLKQSANLELYLEEFGATLEKDFGSNLLLITLPNAAQTIDVANALHIREDVLFAHPDFLKTPELR